MRVLYNRCLPIFLFISDVDECSLRTDQCGINADCLNTIGSYSCTCKVGFSGDGINCTGLTLLFSTSDQFHFFINYCVNSFQIIHFLKTWKTLCDVILCCFSSNDPIFEVCKLFLCYFSSNDLFCENLKNCL